jgi:transcriptional regulator
MYIPEYFKENDKDKIKSFIDENDFGILIANVQGTMQAVHIPFMLFENENRFVLKSHFASKNPLAESIKNNNEVLIIFPGPHAYISSSWYHYMNVPTWNYIAVHCYGKLSEVDEKETENILQQMVQRYESSREGGLQWNDYPEKLIANLKKELIAFEINVDRVEAKYKLSQNRNEKDFQSAVAHLENENAYHSKDIAAAMKKIKQK